MKIRVSNLSFFCVSYDARIDLCSVTFSIGLGMSSLQPSRLSSSSASSSGAAAPAVPLERHVGRRLPLHVNGEPCVQRRELRVLLDFFFIGVLVELGGRVGRGRWRWRWGRRRWWRCLLEPQPVRKK
jgi:hypothetical protein